MKLAQLNNLALSSDLMKKAKGGATVTLETQIDVVSVGAGGTTDLLYCDRRRKKINC